MGRFSSWQPVIPSLSEGLDYLGASLDKQRDYELRRKDSEQKARFENEQNAAIMAGKKEQARRDRAKEAQEQADRQLRITQNLSALLGKGQDTNAQAVAAASQFEDPSTGQMRGVQLTPEYAAPAPTARMDTGGGNQALARFLHGQAAPQATEPPPQGQEAAPAPEPDPQAVDDTTSALDFMEQQTVQPMQAQQQQAHDASKQFRATFPSGQSTVIDPSEAKRAAVQEAEDNAKRYESAAMNEPDGPVRQQFLRAAAQVRAGMSNADRAGVNNVESREDAQDFKANQQDKFEMTAGQKYDVGKTRAQNAGRGQDWRQEETTRRGDFAEGNYAHGIADRVLSRYGFTDLQVQNRKFNDMARDLSTSPNAALDAKTAGSWVKQAQGGTGVISDKDMAQFWDRIGGLGVRTLQELDNALSGTLGPEKRAIVLEAVQQLAAQARNNLDTIKGQMDFAYRSDPVAAGNPQWRIQALGTYFPDERAKIDQAGNVSPPPRQWQQPRAPGHHVRPAAPPPAATPPPGGPPPPPAAPSLDAALQAAQARYKANPNDTKARDFLRANGKL